jgi:hypothetical protein
VPPFAHLGALAARFGCALWLRALAARALGKMMSPAARYVVPAVVGIASWQGLVALKRNAHERTVKQRVVADRQGRKIRDTFTAGSTEDTISESLQTGDLVFFNRPCFVMRPCGSAVCAATKWASPNERRYDHVGMIVVGKDYKPMLVEQTHGGTKLRPWDERLSRSLAGEVVIRPLRMRRTKEAMDRLLGIVETTVGGGAGGDNGLGGGAVEAMRSLQLLFSRYQVGGRLDTKEGKITGADSAAAASSTSSNTRATSISAAPASMSPSCNSSAALVGSLLQELGVMAKEGERGYIRPGNLCPEDFLNLRYLNNAKLRDPIFVRQLV